MVNNIWVARHCNSVPRNANRHLLRYTKIREAITDDPDFALTMYNTNWRLLGLPEDHAHGFKEKVVETYAPEALEYIDTSLKLGKLAKRYPAFIASVHSSFYSPIELAKVRTRVVV